MSLLRNFAVIEAQNVSLGQGGSIYTTAGSDAIKPPAEQEFIAITMVTDTVFDSSNGLVATDASGYVNTETAAHDLSAGSETTSYGSGGQVVDSVTFSAGMTIYGRWSEIDVLS